MKRTLFPQRARGQLNSLTNEPQMDLKVRKIAREKAGRTLGLAEGY